MMDAERLDASGKAADRAGGEQNDQDVPADVDTAIFGELRVLRP